MRGSVAVLLAVVALAAPVSAGAFSSERANTAAEHGSDRAGADLYRFSAPNFTLSVRKADPPAANAAANAASRAAPAGRDGGEGFLGRLWGRIGGWLGGN